MKKIIISLSDDFGRLKLSRKRKKKAKKALLKYFLEGKCEYCGSKNIVDPISDTCFNGMCKECGSNW